GPDAGNRLPDAAPKVNIDSRFRHARPTLCGRGARRDRMARETVNSSPYAPFLTGMLMKRATPLPFVGLVLLCLVPLFVKGWSPQVPKGGEFNAGDVAWMLTAAGLVLLMTPGLSFFYGGMVSFKNVVSTMLQSLVALGVISLVWVVIGFSLAFGDDLGGV